MSKKSEKSSWAGTAAIAPRVAAQDALGHIPAFAEGILFVRCEGGDPGWSDPGSYYILRDQTLLFMIEATTGEWIRFLRQIDGARSIAAILGQLGISAGAIWKQVLATSVSYGVFDVQLSTEAPAAGSACTGCNSRVSPARGIR